MKFSKHFTYVLTAVLLLFSTVVLVEFKDVFTIKAQSVAALLMAKSSPATDKPVADFFNKAWKTSSSSNNYQFVCTVTSGNVKTPTENLTPDQKRAMELLNLTLPKFKSRMNGTLDGKNGRLSFVEDKVDTLSILNSLGSGVTVDQAIKAANSVTSQNTTFMTADKKIYFKGVGDMKIFEDPETSSKLYKSLSSNSITSPLDKSSLKFNKFIAGNALYEGTFTQSQTASALAPFIGTEEANKQKPIPVQVFLDKTSGLMQKYVMSDNLKVWGIEFTVSETCTFDFKNTKVTVPAKATKMEKDAGMAEFSKLLQSL